MSSLEIPVSDAVLDDLSRRGNEIYARLQALLEPAQNNRFVAIHVDTGDYEVGRSSAAAMRAILSRHLVDGRLFIRKIGTEPEYGLAARLLAAEMKAHHSK